MNRLLRLAPAIVAGLLAVIRPLLELADTGAQFTTPLVILAVLAGVTAAATTYAATHPASKGLAGLVVLVADSAAAGLIAERDLVYIVLSACAAGLVALAGIVGTAHARPVARHLAYTQAA